MDNRSHQEADWDLDILGPELAELSALSFDLSLTGFNPREIDAFTLTPNAAEDEVPPVPQTPVSRLGDLWLCGPHRVLCADATSAADVARLLDQSCGSISSRLRMRDEGYKWKQRFFPQLGEPQWRIEIREYDCDSSNSKQIYRIPPR